MPLSFYLVWQCCRNEGSQLEDDNARITSDIELQRGELEEGKAQLQYYTNHQVETEQKVCLHVCTHQSAHHITNHEKTRTTQQLACFSILGQKQSKHVY